MRFFLVIRTAVLNRAAIPLITTGERLNLTLRQGSAYLGRRPLGQALWKQCLEDQLELLRCRYNFVKPHRVWNFEGEFKITVVQAGSTDKRLTLRAMFSSTMYNLKLHNVTFEIIDSVLSSGMGDSRPSMAA